MNKIIFTGHLGRDPELRFTAEGTAVCTLNVAAKLPFNKNADTIWFRASVWNAAAESSAKHLHKGSQVLIEGELTPDASGNPRTYQRTDGTTAASYEVRADRVEFLGSGGKQETTDERAGYETGEFDGLDF